MPLRRTPLAFLIPAACLTAVADLAVAAGPPLVELTVGPVSHQGQVIARGPQRAWLMERDGQLRQVELAQVTDFRRLPGDFRPFGTDHLRRQLQKEFGREFETAATRRYVVCAPHGSARVFADLFERTCREFRLYFGVRGFSLPEPEFPLVAVVFPNREAFAEYCRREEFDAAGIVGVYMTRSNRVALYDPKDDPPKALGAIDTGLLGTIVHEATHQLAYNTGLHARIGENPRWVVEGLATVFEAPGVRDASKNRAAESRINRGRYVDFRGYMPRRAAKSLAAFVSEDAPYGSSPADAYAEGWALSFYLLETRPREYAGYLKKIADRDPLTVYPAEERLADFKQSFGNHVEVLEADFLRYMERLK